MTNLLHSRKFMTMLVDLVVSLATYFVGKYAVPELANDVLFVIGAIQPVFLALIAAITVEDAQAYKAGVHPNQIKVWVSEPDEPPAEG